AATGRRRGESLLVETGAKASTRAGQHDGAQTGRAAQPLARCGDRLEHRRIERVELVRAIERDLGDSGGDFNSHAVTAVWWRCFLRILLHHDTWFSPVSLLTIPLSTSSRSFPKCALL